MTDAATETIPSASNLIVLEQPDAPDGRTWLVCAPQPVSGMPTYAVVSAHRRRADALAELVDPEDQPLLGALRTALPWLDREGDAVVHHARRIAQALAAEGFCVCKKD